MSLIERLARKMFCPTDKRVLRAAGAAAARRESVPLHHRNLMLLPVIAVVNDAINARIRGFLAWTVCHPESRLLALPPKVNRARVVESRQALYLCFLASRVYLPD